MVDQVVPWAMLHRDLTENGDTWNMQSVIIDVQLIVYMFIYIDVWCNMRHFKQRAWSREWVSVVVSYREEGRETAK